MKKGLSNFIFIIILLFLFSGCNLLNGLSEITPIIQEDLLNPKIPENYETTLPILLIDANKKMIIDEPKIDATFKLYQDEINKVINGNKIRGEVVISGKCGIEVRGASSKFNPKHSFNFKTIDEEEKDIDVVFLGMGPEKDWVLYAPYKDRSLMKNWVGYLLSNKIGLYAPRTRFVELHVKDNLRSEYRGIYLLTEKITPNSTRVDIGRDGFIFEITNSFQLKDGDKYFSLKNRTNVVITPTERWLGYAVIRAKYPKKNKITDAEFNEAKRRILDFDNLLYEGDFQNPIWGYEAHIDIDSFIDYLILLEVYRNSDAMERSTYVNMTKEGKIKMGPIWDLNTSFQEKDYGILDLFGESKITPEGWHYKKKRWMGKLMEDDKFRIKFVNRWKEVSSKDKAFDYKLIEEIIHDILDYLTISGAVERDYNRWPESHGNPNLHIIGNHPTTHEIEVKKLLNWFYQRINWINEHINELNY